MGRASRWVRSVVYGVEDLDVAESEPVMRASLTWGTPTYELAGFTIDDRFLNIVTSREVAVAVPALKRARDSLCSVVSSLPFKFMRRTTVDVEDEEIEPALWAERPDPAKTRGYMLAWTVDDLIWHAEAFWEITQMTTAGRAQSFRRLPATSVKVASDGLSLTVNEKNGTQRTIPNDRVLQFCSPFDPLLVAARRHISIARKLDAAAERFADVEIPSGYLSYDGDEDVDQDELNELADMWTVRRKTNATAALPRNITFEESTSDPQRLQLTQARQHEALELSRLANVPPWLLGAPTGTGMTYQNAQQARLDVLDFGALGFIQCLQETLSGPQVMDLGTYVLLDPSAWLDVATPALDTVAAPEMPMPAPAPGEEVPA